MKKRYKIKFSTTQLIMISFMLAILVGSLLLALPISSGRGEAVPYIDALFTATSATCVTGLTTLTTVSTWSVFGQAVILCLIQIGGLGIITVMSGIMLLAQRKIRLRDSQLIGDSFNLNSLSGISEFVRSVIFGALAVEAAGALAYMTVFVPELGAKGVWVSVFNSVSAFCNAGIDIISETSLTAYATNPVVNLTTCFLIVLGGIGYVVWWDVIRVLRGFGRQGLGALKRLTLHSKIALSTTAILILGGAALYFVFEYSNPQTLGGYSLFDKIQISFFQSVTTRTAGFATVAQENLTGASTILTMILMFIGGSPIGTAGGIKTVTLAVLVATAVSTVRNRDDVSMFGRSLTRQVTRKAVAVTATSLAIVVCSSLLLSFTHPSLEVTDVVYEVVSATATVGLTRGITVLLAPVGKVIIILAMYLGRVGPISLAVLLNFRSSVTNNIKNPTEDVSVG